MWKSWCLVLAVVGGGGCVPEEPATASLAQSVCGEFACGENGGMIAGIPFYGLYLNGIPNQAGVKYLHFARDEGEMGVGTYTPLDVRGAHLRMLDGGTWKDGPDLENGIIEVLAQGHKIWVKIKYVHVPTTGGPGGEPFWTRIGRPSAESYELWWTDPDAPVDIDGHRLYHEVCKSVPLDDELWKHKIDALVFEGEQYDIDTRLISPTGTGDYVAWFNIACAGSVQAKQFLMMRAEYASYLTYHSTIANDRQAMVRAWAAEYCGNGLSFTHSGHKLLMQDHLPYADGKGWIPRVSPWGFSDDEVKGKSVTDEAVWDAHGAVCLETPRLAVDDPNVPPEADIVGQIIAGCGALPPKCSDQPWYPDHWTDHGQLRTAMPVPEP
jgi:hypothetical protein